MNAEKFGTFLANIRKEKGMTQKDLAEVLNVTDKAVSKWERGIGLPDIKMIEPIAEALDISVLEVIKSEKNVTDEIGQQEASKVLSETINLASQQRKEEIRKIIKIVIAMFLIISALFAGHFLKLMSVSRIALFILMMGCGVVLICQALKRKKDKLSYKLMLVMGMVWFVFWAVVVASCIPNMVGAFI